jgi:hypothetical protein
MEGRTSEKGVKGPNGGRMEERVRSMSCRWEVERALESDGRLARLYHDARGRVGRGKAQVDSLWARGLSLACLSVVEWYSHRCTTAATHQLEEGRKGWAVDALARRACRTSSRDVLS